jgi:hypothetical protein
MLIRPRPELIRKTRLASVMLMAMVCIACQPKRELQLSGKTMGTTYHIKVVTGWFTSGADLQRQINNRLAVINKSMSTYDPTSEISRFNAIDSTSEAFSPSDDFLNVLQVAAALHKLTEGAWDGTLDPLINLWGFGRNGVVSQIPNSRQIQQALSHVGFDRIRLDPSGTISKTDPAVTLDLASIAKGYGVDEICPVAGRRGVFATFWWRSVVKYTPVADARTASPGRWVSTDRTGRPPLMMSIKRCRLQTGPWPPAVTIVFFPDRWPTLFTHPRSANRPAGDQRRGECHGGG